MVGSAHWFAGKFSHLDTGILTKNVVWLVESYQYKVTEKMFKRGHQCSKTHDISSNNSEVKVKTCKYLSQCFWVIVADWDTEQIVETLVILTTGRWDGRSISCAETRDTVKCQIWKLPFSLPFSALISTLQVLSYPPVTKPLTQNLSGNLGHGNSHWSHLSCFMHCLFLWSPIPGYPGRSSSERSHWQTGEAISEENGKAHKASTSAWWRSRDVEPHDSHSTRFDLDLCVLYAWGNN